MTGYLLLRHTHALLAVLSLLLFVGRGVSLVVLERPLSRRWLRVLPHGVDTLLLASGVTLMVWSSQYPQTHAWLGLKLLLLVAYILLGLAAFRLQRPRGLRLALFGTALAVFACILAIALTRELPGAGVWS